MLYSKFNEVASKQYAGAGKAWAAIKNDEVVSIIYMNDNSIATFKKVVKIDKRYKSGGKVTYVNIDTRDEFSKFRAESIKKLEKFGEVKSGMMSCCEFITK